MIENRIILRSIRLRRERLEGFRRFDVHFPYSLVLPPSAFSALGLA